MMLLTAVSLALLVIYAGTKLLIQVNKESLGTSYKYASWFFIVSGFLVLVLAGALSIAMCFKYGFKMMKKERHMSHQYFEGGGDHEYNWHNKWMKHGEYEHMGDGKCAMYMDCCKEKESNCCETMCKPDTTCKKPAK